MSEERTAGLRTAVIERATNETSISVHLSIDGSGQAEVATGIGFFDHMLTAFAKHGLFNLKVTCHGDLHVDGHHSVEDVGICLGQAFQRAVGGKEGIVRFGQAIVPLDEAVVQCVVDFSGRPYLGYHHFNLTTGGAGAFEFCLLPEFLRAFAVNAGLTMHVWQLAGDNPHHIIEAAFKACARACEAALQRDLRVSGAPSTKGVL